MEEVEERVIQKENQLINFMEEINKKAQVVGGAVLSLIGNHEVMNLIGDFRYASEHDIEEVGGLDVRKKLFKPGGELFNRLSCTRNVVVKIGSWVFVHAGVLPKHVLEHKVSEDNTQKVIKGDKWFESVNNIMRLFMQGKKTTFDSEVQKLFLNESGMIWDRQGSENPECEDWDKTKKFYVDKTAHTIQDSINTK